MRSHAVPDDSTTQRLNAEGADLLVLAGVNDANLVELSRQTGARIALRGDTLSVAGSPESVERATAIAQRMIDAARQRLTLDADDVLRMSLDTTRDSNDGTLGAGVVLSAGRNSDSTASRGTRSWSRSSLACTRGSA